VTIRTGAEVVVVDSGVVVLSLEWSHSVVCASEALVVVTTRTGAEVVVVDSGVEVSVEWSHSVVLVPAPVLVLVLVMIRTGLEVVVSG